MRDKFVRVAALVLLACLMPVAIAAAVQQTYWKGSSAGYAVDWSSEDLRVADEKTGATVFSASDHARTNFDRVKNRLKPGQRYEEDYELLSLVGPVLSLEYHARIFAPGVAKSVVGDVVPGTTITGVTRYVAIDLRDPSGSTDRLASDYEQQLEQAHAIKLSDVFAEKDVLAAFSNDTIIQSTVDTSSVKSLRDLVKSLQGKHLPAPDMCGKFDWGLLNEFGVHHLRGTKAAVRFGISGSEPRPELLSELGMLVSIPAAWQPKFLLAAEGKEGVLMGTLKRKTGPVRTHFEFKSDKKH
ncbi:MAG: hypothetical protein K2W95_19555 [Candidatus Obscuribacterales bacterium]|nr:hypothetical protein [Candidatus Obscuribacterales bacterium]